jgi:asparagine N-glycosylation enzyme membrane subunit Stt3
MFSAISRKIFFICCVPLLLFASSGCWRSVKTGDAPPTVFAADELKSDVPFATKEPENFQAEFVVTANDEQTKTFFARAGEKRRIDYASGAKNQLTILQNGARQSFLIFPAEKIYVENTASQIHAQGNENWKDFLTNQLLYQKAEAKYTSLGTENGTAKYSVELNDGKNGEAIVFVNEQINLPVRQEFYSIRNGEKNLRFVFEMRNFKLQTDENLFEIPKNYKKVSPESLRASMRKDNFNDE